MRIECQALKLEVKIRGDPVTKQHGILEYVNKASKRCKKSKYTYRVDVSTQHYAKSYSRGY